MKMVKDKQILVAADFGGFELKEAVVKHLKERGWTVTDVGMKAGDTGEPEMYQRIGLRAGAMVAEGEFERALLFCGTGMGSISRPANVLMCTARSLKPSLPPCGA